MSTKDDKKLIQRFDVGLKYCPDKRRIFQNIAMCLIIIGAMVLSYAFIIQPAATPPELQRNEVFTITPENSYLVDNGDGTYTVCTNGMFIGDVKDINVEPFSNLKVIEKDR